jgi:hypothetical protein
MKLLLYLIFGDLMLAFALMGIDTAAKIEAIN